jgi:curved DNA-binding protein CbpA
MRPETRHLLAYLDKVEPVLHKLTYYELLDVTPTASAQDIQAAYHLVAQRMHPDRHRSELTAAQYERLNVVYGRITEAYRVLRTPAERDRYAQSVGHQVPEPADEASAAKLLSPKAQRLYRRAKAALRTGDRASAILNLKMALRDHPNSALLKSFLSEVNAGAKPS